MIRSGDIFQMDDGTRMRYDEVCRLMHLCDGALEGLCSITIREDVRKQSIDANIRLGNCDHNLLRAAYAMADEVDMLSTDSLIQVHEILYPGCSMLDGTEAAVRDLFDGCFHSDLPITVQAAIIHNGLIAIHPFEEGNRTLARVWYSELLGRSYKTFQYVSLESEFLRTSEEYRRFANDPEDTAGFVNYSLDCCREGLSRLLGSMW